MVDHRDIDRDTKIRVLRSAATHVTGNEERALRLLPDIAHRVGLTLEQVKAIVEAHGWPRPKSMMRAADILTAGKEVQEGDLPEVQQPATSRPTAAPADDRLVMVEIAHLAPDPDNVRDDLGDLSEMVASIEDMGILQPIVARRHEGKVS
ncbi:ParB N-terminal domain-containing protein [Nocardioides sp. W3-2-3]|nr:ParB N-terminal domain-containing protein [Nocardioides convexus]